MAGNHAHPDDATVRTEAVGGGARATRGTARDAVDAQRARFGGIKWGAAFFGWLTANGLAVILVALLSAAGVALGLAQNVDTTDEAARQAETLGIGGGIAILVVLFLAYLAGGYVAGRMARFDGARQGFAVWLVGLLVVLILAGVGVVLGSQYNVLQQLNLPRIPIDEGTATTAGIITLVAILLVTLAGAVLGGKLGDRYHRKVDRAGFDV
jgi:MFS family permease